MTDTDRMKTLKEVLAIVEREPELPGSMPIDLRARAMVRPESFARHTVGVTKDSIADKIRFLIRTEYLDELLTLVQSDEAPTIPRASEVSSQPVVVFDLQLKAVARCEDVFFPLSKWSPAEWGNALAGEVGEACNLLKKILRGDAVDVDDVGDELADVSIYAALTASRVGIDLADAIRRKFNRVSDEKGSPIKL